MEELGDVYRGVLLAPVVLMGAGVLWSPFGAGVCALVAWLQRQPIGEAAGAGFSHSLLLLLPWFYLLGRTLG
ncbi:MAG: hypothetical protein OXT51_00560, partial [Chloroflexota bacterium]|nr:hypothetical protein [Chloroflexota bacterium]